MTSIGLPRPRQGNVMFHIFRNMALGKLDKEKGEIGEHLFGTFTG